ncbi:hypothetical protein [Cellulomonas soli]
MRRALSLTIAPLAVVALLTACSGGSDSASDPTGAATSAQAEKTPAKEADAVAPDEAGLAALQLTAAELGEGWTSLDLSGTEDLDPASALPEGVTFEPAECGQLVSEIQAGTALEPDAQSNAAYTKADGTFVGVTLSTGGEFIDGVFDGIEKTLSDCTAYSATFPELFTASYAVSPLEHATLGDRSDAIVIDMTIDGQPSGSTAVLMSQTGDVVVAVMTSGVTTADTALLEQAASLAVAKVDAGA